MVRNVGTTARGRGRVVSTYTLRPYQSTGKAFLLARRFAILGDAMGLGKSPQSICAAAALLADKPHGRVIIAAPAATLPGLAREVERWAGVHATVLDARGKVSADAPGFLLVAWTSLAKRLPELLAGRRFLAFIADEAHRVKNPKAGVTKAALGAWSKNAAGQWVRSVNLAEHAERVWALTGTPIPNRPIEMQPLLHLAGNLRWASRTTFGDAFCRRTNRWAPRGFDYLGARCTDELHRRLVGDGILLRRLPEDVPGELPTLTTSIVPLAGCDDDNILRTAGLDPDAIRAAVGEGSTIDFEELAAYRAAMGERKAPAVAGWVADWLDDNEGEALVVFVWHKAAAAKVAADLGNDEDGNPVAWVATGDDTPAERQAMVDRFAAGERRVFIGSIAACGTGLNGLHLRTTYCAFGEVAWTPGELTQAIGRVRRFGSVGEHAHAWILVGEDSLEDHVMQTIAGKLDVSAAILGDTAAAGSASAAASAPVAAIAAPAPRGDDEPAQEPDPTPEPTERAWTWAKLKGSDAWGLRCDHTGSDAWNGAEVTVYNRAGQAKLVGIGARVAGGEGWSVYTLAELKPPARDREYFRRRIAARGVAGVEDTRELTNEERADAFVLHAAAERLTGLDPDRAQVRNDAGWNSADGKVGSVLAAIPPEVWDAGTLTAARSVVRRYTLTQVPMARAAAVRAA
jgi:SWI/SNF-related matrix-associated actin-dependent regulator of chromatin subfamily A-like protein 1